MLSTYKVTRKSDRQSFDASVWSRDLCAKLPGLPPTTAERIFASHPTLSRRSPSVLATDLLTLAAAIETPIDVLAQTLTTAPGILYLKPNQVLDRIHRASASLHITPARTLELFLSHPPLFILTSDRLLSGINSFIDIFGPQPSHHPTGLFIVARLACRDHATLIDNIQALANHFATDTDTVLASVRRCPTILNFKPSTIIANSEKLAAAFSLTPPVLFHAFRHHPELLVANSRRVLNNAKRLAQTLRIPLTRIHRLALLQPMLLTTSPKTTRSRLNALAAALNISPDTLGQAASRHPSLLLARPPTILANIDAAGRLLRIDRPALIRIFLRQPQLFAAKPTTLLTKARYLHRIDRTLHNHRPLADLLWQHPIALSFSRLRLYRLLCCARKNPSANLSSVLKQKLPTSTPTDTELPNSQKKAPLSRGVH